MILKVNSILAGRYQIEGKIGAGGMADVYKALDRKLNRNVAIKVLKDEFASDRTFVSKFRMEAQSAACLNNPNIVKIFDVGEESGVYYIVMEYIDGITLKKYIARRGRLGIREVLEVGLQVAYGLEAAHSEHIVHRDINPQNIMISKEGKVYVTDFGIARATSNQTIGQNTMGSVYYISPEQAKGGFCDERSDIYSLGITMYEMLTGRVPFEGDSTVSVALQHIQSEMPSPSKIEPLIPISLEKIVLKCTGKKPEDRYASASELIDDLKKALTSPNEDFVSGSTVGRSAAMGAAAGATAGAAMAGASAAMADDKTKFVDTDGVNKALQVENIRSKKIDPEDDLDSELDEPIRERRPSANKKKKSNGLKYKKDPKEIRLEKIVKYFGIFLGVFVVGVVVLVIVNVTKSRPENPEESKIAVEGKVEMPDLKGKTLIEATEILEKLELKISPSYGESKDYPVGQIFEQDFKPGSMVDKGLVINVTISSGTETIVIPEIAQNSTESYARQTLQNAGFTNIMTMRETNSSVPAGNVIRIEPMSGTKAPSNAVVTIVISDGAKKANVPNVVGLSESAAMSKIDGAGLYCDIKYEHSSDVEKGYVISQSVSSGSDVTAGTTITITVSSGPEEALVTVDNVVGMSESSAASLLSSKGLNYSIDREYSNKDKGIVIGQDQTGQVKKGTTITITVSDGPEPTQPTSEPESTTESSVQAE